MHGGPRHRAPYVERLAPLAIALASVLGCAPGDADGAGAGGAGGTAGGGASGPMPTTPPRLDGGTHDAGATDAGTDADAPAPPPHFVLDCAASTPAEAQADPRAAWEAERTAHGALGYGASFALRGAAYRITGQTASAIHAPLVLRSKGSSHGLISFADAEVEGIEETGRVELYPGSDPTDFREASATSGRIEGLAFRELGVEGGALTGALALTEERIGNTYRFYTDAVVRDLEIERARTVYLYPEGTIGLAERIEWMPTGPVVIRSASRLTFYDAEGAELLKTLSDPVELEYASFGVAGDFEGGALAIPELDVDVTPLAVFGTDGTVRAEDGSVASAGDFRVTQAMTAAGLVIPAEVEVVPSHRELWVQPSKTRVIELYYRERSYRGDAVLAKIETGGDANRLLELQTGFIPTLTVQLIDAIIDTGWAAPVVALTTIPVVPIVFFIDIFSCLFGGCAAAPDPLAPYPLWMQAGEIGAMELRIKAPAARGTYQTTLTFAGRNYCPVTVALTVHVGDPPADEDAGAP